MKLNGVFGRLITANLAALIFIAVFMSYIFTLTQRLNTLLDRISSSELPVIEMTDRLKSIVLKQAEFREKYLISKDPDFSARYGEYSSEAANTLSELDKILNGKTKKAAYAKLDRAYSGYIQLLDNTKDIVPAKSVQLVIEAIEDLRIIAAKQRKESLDLSQTLAGQVKASVIVFVLSGAVLFALMAFINTRSIVDPIKKLRDSAHEVADGKYPELKTDGGPHEIRQLTGDFNVMVKRLRETDEMRSEFIGNVSHELRTPLTSIREASELLREGYFKDNTDSNEKLLNIIKNESDRMINSVNNILEITRLDMEQASYSIKLTDISSVAAFAIEKTAPIASRKQITVTSLLKTGETVLADGEKLEIVFVNLIGNALKYSDAGTAVTISANKSDGFLTVCVDDSGIGIDDDELPLIFERYVRGSGKAAEYKGAGLGLAICRKIIAKHGGEIWAQSSSGQGSRFYFTLRLV